MGVRWLEQAIKWEEVRGTSHCKCLYAPPCKDKLKHSVTIKQTKTNKTSAKLKFKVTHSERQRKLFLGHSSLSTHCSLLVTITLPSCLHTKINLLCTPTTEHCS